MKNKNFFGMFLLMCIVACNSKPKENSDSKDVPPSNVSADPSSAFKKSIMGRWRLPESNSLFLEIDESTLQYIDGIKIPYRHEKNYLFMSNPDGSIDTAEVKVSGDTLFLKNSQDEKFTAHIRYY